MVLAVGTTITEELMTTTWFRSHTDDIRYQYMTSKDEDKVRQRDDDNKKISPGSRSLDRRALIRFNVHDTNLTQI